MNDADQTIENWHYSNSWEPIAKYALLVGGPGTIYQNCGAFDDVLTLDNGELLPGHFRNTVLDLTSIKHVRLFNRAKAEFESSANIEHVSGDTSGTSLTLREHGRVTTPLTFEVTGGVRFVLDL